jgi:hypothetical protein
MTVTPPRSTGPRLSSSEFLRSLVLAPVPFGPKAHLPRFRPSSRLHFCASTCREASQASLRAVLRFSQPLDGFFRTKALRAYFIPLPRPGFPVQGLLPSPSHPSSSEGDYPRAVPSHRAHRPESRLPRRENATSRFFSGQGCVLPVELFTAPELAPLLSFLSSRSSPFPPCLQLTWMLRS